MTWIIRKIGIVKIKNGCCPDKPVIVYDNQNGTFHCACECGMWCTNGRERVSDAIREYEDMSK